MKEEEVKEKIGKLIEQLEDQKARDRVLKKIWEKYAYFEKKEAKEMNIKEDDALLRMWRGDGYSWNEALRNLKKLREEDDRNELRNYSEVKNNEGT